MPATIALERFQTEQRFVAALTPKLPGPFEAALILAAAGFNGPRTQRFIGQLDLLDRSGALLARFSGREDFFVLHARSILLEIIDLALEFLLLSWDQSSFEFTEAGDDLGGLVLVDTLQQRRDPLARFGRAAAVQVMGDGPKMFFGMPKIQSLARLAKAISQRVPNPDGAIGQD